MMVHVGDITKIHGYDLEPVDVITGGSPCQDLSVAGKRAGLAGERSGLFMEQIRVIKEMRYPERYRTDRADKLVRPIRDEDRKPRYAIWENVPGALSSPGGEHKGEDFQAVLEEFVHIVCEEAPAIPIPKNGWPSAGCLTDGVDGRWSIAWRIHDAQFWGVPQRRRRISLVADFAGLTATEILFERESLQRDSEPSIEEGQGAAGDIRESVEESKAYTLQIRGGR